MATKREKTPNPRPEIRRYGFADPRITAEIQRLSRPSLGQSCPQHCPSPSDTKTALGEPIAIREVARLIGCSAWTVRQRYLPQGLPHLRSGPAGKIVFFRDQIIRWILERQQKGGK